MFASIIALSMKIHGQTIKKCKRFESYFNNNQEFEIKIKIQSYEWT
jgi:hypothetical protein